MIQEKIVQQKRTHVPKFGNFESDSDIPYTAYFDKARQDKGTGVRMNPNDPEQNPEAFMYVKKENGSRNGSRRDNHRRTNSRSTTSESGSYNSNSSNFGNKNRGKNMRKKSMTESEYFVPPSPGPDRHRKTSDAYSDVSIGSVSVPKFGAWDKKDPTSGEGFTVLFNKVKEEKHIAASKFPVVPPQVVTHTKAHKEKTIKSKPKMHGKKWCCLFPREN